MMGRDQDSKRTGLKTGHYIRERRADILLGGL